MVKSAPWEGKAGVGRDDGAAARRVVEAARSLERRARAQGRHGCAARGEARGRRPSPCPAAGPSGRGRVEASDRGGVVASSCSHAAVRPCGQGVHLMEKNKAEKENVRWRLEKIRQRKKRKEKRERKRKRK